MTSLTLYVCEEQIYLLAFIKTLCGGSSASWLSVSRSTYTWCCLTSSEWSHTSTPPLLPLQHLSLFAYLDDVSSASWASRRTLRSLTNQSVIDYLWTSMLTQTVFLNPNSSLPRINYNDNQSWSASTDHSLSTRSTHAPSVVRISQRTRVLLGRMLSQIVGIGKGLYSRSSQRSV